LVAVHGGSPVPGRFDAHRVVEAYRDTSEAHGVRVPDHFRWAKGWSDRIELARGTQPNVPCHNDLLNGNFIHDGSRVRIVDWEYAGMGDRFFDLANFSINHEFQPEHDEILLAAYFGEATPGRFASLRLMRFMSDFREAMWGVVQQGISDLDFDFVAYAGEHFDRLRATAADPRFEGWLDESRTV
jgi:thiamine kinase-like enzyme